MDAWAPIDDFTELGMEQLLAALLELDPRPTVVALGDYGQFVPLPAALQQHFPDVTGWSWLDLIVPEDRHQVIALWEAMRLDGRASGVVRIIDQPESEAVLQFIGAESPGEANLVIAHGVAADSTREGLESVPALRPRMTIVRRDELGILTAVDPAFTQLLGWSAAEAVGKRMLELIHPDDQYDSIRNWMELHATPQHAHRVRVRLAAADGSWLWVEITNRLLPEEAGGPILTEILDISNELATQEALRDRERLFHGLAESLPIGLIQVDSNGNVLYTNARLPAILGTAPAEALDEQFRNVVDEDRSLLVEALRSVRDGGPDAEVEVRFRARADSSLRWCRLTIRRLEDDDGAVSGAIICVADVTDNAARTGRAGAPGDVRPAHRLPQPGVGHADPGRRSRRP